MAGWLTADHDRSIHGDRDWHTWHSTFSARAMAHALLYASCMRLLVLLLLSASTSACGASTSDASSEGVSSDDGGDDANDARSGETSIGVSTSCHDPVHEGVACSGSFSCDQGTVSCCIGGEIQSRALYVCTCRDGTISCYPTDACWGVPYACVDAEPPDAGDANGDADASD
jgi:hypothetical protein